MTNNFVVPPSLETEARNYYKFKSPADSANIIWQCFAEPVLQRFGAISNDDTTFGREGLPRAPDESQLRSDPRHSVSDCRVQLDDHSHIYYQTWQDTDAARKNKNTASLLLCHGINDYGGKWATHAERFLRLGWRLIIPDLPSHARSSGLHVYITSTNQFIGTLDAVLNDVAARDAASGRRESQTFIAGASMGGFACASYAIYRNNSEIMSRASIAGVVLLCPMLEVASESRPSYLVELVARFLRMIAGRLPLASANKGKNSEDASVEIEFEQDPQTYHGKLRIATGLSFLEGMLDVSKRFAEMQLPFLCIHGTGDRVTSFRETQRFFREAQSADKSLKLFDGYEHILLRRGRDPADDLRRQAVFDVWIEWLEARRMK